MWPRLRRWLLGMAPVDDINILEDDDAAALVVARPVRRTSIVIFPCFAVPLL